MKHIFGKRRRVNASSRPRLLLVNDESFVLLAYENQLESSFEITTAENGHQAVKIVKAHSAYHFAVIILDINMPIMNGWDACDRIHEYLSGDNRLESFHIKRQIWQTDDF